MATAAQQESLKAFIKASKGKEGVLIDSKTNKRILTDTKMIAKKYIDQNGADIALSKIVAKVGAKAATGLSMDQYCNEYATEIGSIICKKMKNTPEEGKAAFLKAIEESSPEFNKTTAAQKGGATGRLTDTSKYTGSHKERFDESGKGKGLEGREDVTKNTGYTGQYKGEGSYDKK